MQSITNLLLNSSRKAAKFLQRDFFELEMLQNSQRSAQAFSNKSYSRTKELLYEDAQKSFNGFSINVLHSDQKFIADTTKDLLLIQPIDSLSNLERAIPFFAIALTYLKTIKGKLVPTNCVINFPALNEIYYAENGGGSWVEKNSFASLGHPSRLRVSGVSDIRQGIVALSNTTIFSQPCKNFLYFSSDCYSIALLAAGKIDIASFDNINYTLKYPFELIVKEAGGLISYNNNHFIATNSNFAGKAEQLLTKSPS